MTSRRIGSGLGVALSIASVYLTLNTPVLAQDEPADTTAAEGTAAADDASDPAATSGALDSGPTTAAAKAPEPEPEAEPAEEPSEPHSAPEAEAPETATAAPDAPSQEGEATMPIPTVEVLPGSAYPAAYIRGIKYGSLSGNFHGQQFPYLPDPKTGMRVGFSGYFWNDLSRTSIDTDERLRASSIFRQNRWQTQTRGIVRVTPTYNAGDGWFAQGNGEVVVLGDMRPDPATQVTTNTEDVYVRVGKWDLFDVTVGRFQGWEIANHFGMALDYATLERQGAWVLGESIPKPTDGYGLTYFWDRQNFLLGTYALHVYPTEYLRGELLGHIGAGTGNAPSPYQMDIRPSGIFDIGWVKLKAGYEYGKSIPSKATLKQRDTRNGWGLGAQFVLDPYVEFGGSFARGYQDVLDQFGNVNLEATNTVQTVGGFLNASPGYEPLVFGFGAFWNEHEDFRTDFTPGAHFGEVDTNKQRQLFAAVQYTLWERMHFKFVLAHSQNTVRNFQYPIYTNEALSGRFRMMVTY